MAVVEVFFLVIFWAWVVCAFLFLRNTYLPRLPIPDISQSVLPRRTVQFHAVDGVPLEGWVVCGDPSRPWVILCHGLGTNRADLLDVASSLHRAGFNLFLFDFRAHGNSAGRVTSFGWLERRDLEGALAYLGSQPEIPARPYGLYGISMGGAVGLMAAAHDERLGALAVDSPYVNLEETLGRHLTLMYPLPRVPFLWFVLATYRLRFGVWPNQVSPQADAARLSPRPLFLINGAEDPRMPATGARRIFASAGEPKTLWLIDGAGHLEGPALVPEEYHSRVVGFFQEHLR